MWDLIVSVPDHCLSFYFSMQNVLVRKNPDSLFDCDTHWDLFIIVSLPWASQRLWCFLCHFIIVIHPVPLYDCNTSWAFMIVAHFMIVKFLVPLYDCNTSLAFKIVAHFMIVKLLVAPLWLWHSLRPLYDCGVLSLSIKINWWLVNWINRIGITWYRWSNMLVWEWYL